MGRREVGTDLSIVSMRPHVVPVYPPMPHTEGVGKPRLCNTLPSSYHT